MLSSHTREDGFTLIELLVAMAASIVLMTALITLMITVLDGTATTYARISATRGTRGALAQIENELHSACVGTGTTQSLAPIEAGNAETLSFVSYTGPGINPTPTWHKLSFADGELNDASYAVTGGNGVWTPARTPTSTQVLLQNVTPQTDGSGADIPYFQYFAYVHYAGPDSDEDYWTIPDGTDTLPNGTTPPATPLGYPLITGAGGTAATVVEVLITFAGGPQETKPADGFTQAPTILRPTRSRCG